MTCTSDRGGGKSSGLRSEWGKAGVSALALLSTLVLLSFQQARAADVCSGGGAQSVGAGQDCIVDAGESISSSGIPGIGTTASGVGTIAVRQGGSIAVTSSGYHNRTAGIEVRAGHTAQSVINSGQITGVANHSFSAANGVAILGVVNNGFINDATGTITAIANLTGADVAGIMVDADDKTNSVINQGTIEARAEGSVNDNSAIYGIYLREGATSVFNDGIVMVRNATSRRVYALIGILGASDENTVIDNSGLINVDDGGAGVSTPLQAAGISIYNAVVSAAITNDGVINVNGDSSAAGAAAGIRVQIADTATITNRGGIFVQGNGQVGIDIGQVNGVTIVNHGRVQAATAFRSSSGGVSITNDGMFLSTDPVNGHAIQFSGTDNELTLNPGSVIIGRVDLGAGAVVHINTALPIVFRVENDLTPTDNYDFTTTHDILLEMRGGGAGDDYVVVLDRAQRKASAMGVRGVLQGISGTISANIAMAAAAGLAIRATSGEGKELVAHPVAASSDGNVAVTFGSFFSRLHDPDAPVGQKEWNNAFGGLMGLHFLVSPEVLVGLHGGAGRAQNGVEYKSAYYGGVHARLEAEAGYLSSGVTIGKSGGLSSIGILDNTGGTTVYTAVPTSGSSGKFVSAELRGGLYLPVDASSSIRPDATLRLTRVRLDANVPALGITSGKASTLFDARLQIGYYHQAGALDWNLTGGLDVYTRNDGPDNADGFVGTGLSARAGTGQLYLNGEVRFDKDGFGGVVLNGGWKMTF